MDKEYFLTRFLKRTALAATSNDKDQTTAIGGIDSILVGDKLSSNVIHVLIKMNVKDRPFAHLMIRLVILNATKLCDFTSKLTAPKPNLSFASDFSIQ
jgi:hypothetical protein